MVDVRRRDRALPSSKPGHRNMDSDKTKQHDNHVQRDADELRRALYIGDA